MHISYKNTGVRISEQVYEPSEDSFLLAEAALYEIENSEKILEVGCGCGIISAVIETNTEAKVIGIDINPFAVVCSKENGIEVIRGDLLSCIRGKFDIIIFNPPYLPTGNAERTGDWLDAALDGGNDGRRVINRFLEDAGNCLAEHGKILLLVSSLTGIDEIKSRLRSLRYSVRERSKERFDFEQLTVLLATKS